MKHLSFVIGTHVYFNLVPRLMQPGNEADAYFSLSCKLSRVSGI